MSNPRVHTHRFRLVMSEVDVAQIHFTALFRWMDRGLSEWLAEEGHSFTRLLDEGPGIPIVDARARFHGRIRLDDVIVLSTWMAAPGNSSFRSRHRFTRDGDLVAEGELVHVCVQRDTRRTLPVPDWLRAVAAPDDWLPPHSVEDPVHG
ncbi:MAG: thioesterase family protein [Thermoleophilia bacterium]